MLLKSRVFKKRKYNSFFVILRLFDLQENCFAWNVGDIYIERKGVLQLSPQAILKLEAKDQRIRARTNIVQNDNNFIR